MHANATTSKARMSIICNLFERKEDGHWHVDTSKPMFEEKVSRSDKEKMKQKHFGRSRLLVEQNTQGGILTIVIRFCELHSMK